MTAARVLAALISVSLGVAHCANIRAAGDGVCEFRGKMLPVGDFNPNPCDQCRCAENGQVMCYGPDCGFIMITGCSKIQNVEGRCCQVCVDGPGCQDPSGNHLWPNQTVTLPAEDGNGVRNCYCDYGEFQCGRVYTP